MSSSFSEPPSRYGHLATSVKDKVFMFGGYSVSDKEGNQVHIFDLTTESWQTKETKGKTPPVIKRADCCSAGSNFYVYGGEKTNSSFYKLDVDSLEWSKLPDGPERWSHGMVAYDGKPLVFGGRDGASYCTNDLHCFEESKMQWSSPKASGELPPKRQDFSITMIGEHHAVLFGGYSDGKGMLDDVQILDLAKMQWTALKKTEGEPWPEKRHSHAAACIGYGGDHPQLLVTGGETTLSDMWLLDLKSGKWKEVDVPELPKREALTAVATNPHPKVTEVTLFGGRPYFCGGTMTDTIVLRFVYQESDGSGEWVLADRADSTKLGTSKRIEEKKSMLKSLASSPATGGTKSFSADDLLKKKPAATDGTPSGRKPKTHWVVERNEMQRAGSDLGKGGWTSVSVVKFRGLKVAAKHIQKKKITPSNKDQIMNEWETAVQLHHPNLVQFIGATVVGEIIILTELMPTSLKKELKDYMAPNQSISIGLDVARALNYLHLMKPNALIHRNITSTNILLERGHDRYWRAKVADFGMVNFFQELEVQHANNPSYAAPEASNSKLHSPMMDIFSLGVVMVEMLTGELPENSKQREDLLRIIRHKKLLALIQKCLNQQENRRPSARAVLQELESLDSKY